MCNGSLKREKYLDRFCGSNAVAYHLNLLDETHPLHNIANIDDKITMDNACHGICNPYTYMEKTGKAVYGLNAKFIYRCEKAGTLLRWSSNQTQMDVSLLRPPSIEDILPPFIDSERPPSIQNSLSLSEEDSSSSEDSMAILDIENEEYTLWSGLKDIDRIISKVVAIRYGPSTELGHILVTNSYAKNLLEEVSKIVKGKDIYDQLDVILQGRSLAIDYFTNNYIQRVYPYHSYDLYEKTIEEKLTRLGYKSEETFRESIDNSSSFHNKLYPLNRKHHYKFRHLVMDIFKWNHNKKLKDLKEGFYTNNFIECKNIITKLNDENIGCFRYSMCDGSLKRERYMDRYCDNDNKIDRHQPTLSDDTHPLHNIANIDDNITMDNACHGICNPYTYMEITGEIIDGLQQDHAKFIYRCEKEGTFVRWSSIENQRVLPSQEDDDLVEPIIPLKKENILAPPPVIPHPPSDKSAAIVAMKRSSLDQNSPSNEEGWIKRVIISIAFIMFMLMILFMILQTSKNNLNQSLFQPRVGSIH